MYWTQSWCERIALNRVQRELCSSISNFEYIFDKRKLLKEYYQDVPGANLDELFDTVEEAEAFIKNEFRKMF